MALFSILPFGLGLPEILIICVIGVLLFGRKLPEVGKYLGKSIVEFKKGMKGLEEEVDTVQHNASQPVQKSSDQIKAPSRVGATAPKFDDVTNPPQV